MFRRTILASALASLTTLSTATATATILWDGRFNASTLSEIEDWSWSNQIGSYQYYIHGSENTTSYLDISGANKNPADTGSAEGVKITLDDTSYWNGQTMRRTELIPQTSAAINKGKVYYHFSMQHTVTNPPSTGEEHQIAFFESHFTEMKSGLLSGSAESSSNALYWMVNSESQWNISDWTAGVWHNIAYGIDFEADTVEFYHSTGAEDLVLVAGPFTASASSDGADWHLGVLRLAGEDGTADFGAEDFYFSGVYVESGDVTLEVSGPGAASSGGSSSSAVAASAGVASSTATSSAVVVSSAAAAGATSASSSAITTAAAAAVATSSSVAPTTLQTLVSSSSVASSSSIVVATTATVSSSTTGAAMTTTSAATSDDDGCVVEYVYV